jgi:hypothetical protein
MQHRMYAKTKDKVYSYHTYEKKEIYSCNWSPEGFVVKKLKINIIITYT